MNPASPNVLQPGLIAFHGNRAEDLAQVVIGWIQRHPLNPLEEEIILVQSNGMAEWIKMELARTGGVCAATRAELPSRFLWRTYRQILGREAVPGESPLDKVPMIWRLMQLLPTLISRPDFAPVAGFLTGMAKISPLKMKLATPVSLTQTLMEQLAIRLSHQKTMTKSLVISRRARGRTNRCASFALKADEPDRMLQLASRLADLFDQYQNYRADWLDAWAQGKNHLVMNNGSITDLPAEQCWQPQLWRAVLQTLDEQQKLCIRPSLHQRVLARLGSGEPFAGRIAQRVIVFGMSQIPWVTLQALAALAPYSQIILAIPNPCRFYWGDIMDGRELLQSQRRRQPFREGRDLSSLPLEEMHAHAHPLLAAWGRQSRDFIRQLDVFDDAEQSRRQFDQARVDLFDESEEDARTPLLRQVQNRIRDLTPLPEHDKIPIADDDCSIVFHSAHSKIRELEILHDQLLLALSNGSLNPRDVIVMVPDIEQMAPFIRAVFGQYRQQDARYIPFDIADMSAKTSSPLIGAIDWLLGLPQQRCRMSELVDLLELPAIAARFGIEQESLPKLTRWMAGAGIRWGLNEAHRTDLGLAACGEQNSAWFGLHRMLLGYASGAARIDDPLAAFDDIEPYPEMGGLEAELAGSLAHLLQTLVNWWTVAGTSAAPETWVERGRTLLSEMVKAESLADRQAVSALEDGLVAWHRACEQAGFCEEVPLMAARTAWLEAIETPGLNQRFRAGGVTFCTLMPMRAIPFEMVCLLGMNDGDYPRQSMRSDFDLMGLPGTSRPGDRSRRDDDRQLMLEALLSARRIFYVSWCGHSVRDNSEQPPSVLVSQLRDYLSSGWGRKVVADRTTQHPLQPFSRRYFEAGSPLHTYAREWRTIHEPLSTAESPMADQTRPPCDPKTAESLPAFNGHGVDTTTDDEARLARFPHLNPDGTISHSTKPSQDDGKVAGYLPEGRAQRGGRSQANESLREFHVNPDLPVTLSQLVRFLRNPAREFFQKRLLVTFADDEEEHDDEECFALDGLQEYGLIRDLLATATAAMETACVTRSLTQLRKAGELPLKGFGDLKQQALQRVLITMLKAWHDVQARFPDAAERQPVRLQAGAVVLEDWIDHLRRGDTPADRSEESHCAWLALEPGNLCENGKKPVARPDKLLGPWVRSLAIAAAGVSARGVLIGRDGVIEISPMPGDESKKTLGMLLTLWLEGMNSPLPLPPGTALAWLTEKNAASRYEGGHMQRGDVQEYCMARMFPDYETLTADGRFEALAQQVYRPLLDWVAQHVTAGFHAGEQTGIAA
jgi:exodeoxyribonuclease V gamma subunit